MRFNSFRYYVLLSSVIVEIAVLCRIYIVEGLTEHESADVLRCDYIVTNFRYSIVIYHVLDELVTDGTRVVSLQARPRVCVEHLRAAEGRSGRNGCL